MTRLLSLVFAVSFCIGAVAALSLGAAATPSYEVPSPAAYYALQTLADHGLLAGYPDETFQGDRPGTRQQMAALVARVISKLQTNGGAGVAKSDLDLVQGLADDYKYELVLLGVRVNKISDLLKPANTTAPFVRSAHVYGAIAGDGSSRQRPVPARTIAGANATDPFVNAFLTSSTNNNPFEHNPGVGSHLRLDAKFNPTYEMSENVAVSLPIRLIQYNGAFAAQDKYLIQPALVLNVGKLGNFKNLYVRGGQLDNMQSSRLSLTYRAPDATQQGPGFQNPVQPYENGVELGGTFNGMTRFQVSWSRIDQSLINSLPGLGDDSAANNYFLTVTPRQNSLVQLGTAVASGGTSHTDTYIANAGPVPSVSLSMKAGLGTVYISAVNGTPCTPAGVTPFGGGPCPIAPGQWIYIDQTNQVVFKSLLPVGTIVQITYALNNASGQFPTYSYQFTREHFNARINQEFKGMPGTELGFSMSRIVDARAPSTIGGIAFGNGYGVLSDTVLGLDARIPLSFVRLEPWDRTEHPVLFIEGASSKYTPDFLNTPAITDSALVVGLRAKISAARFTLQYQAVGPRFFDGGPLRYLGPAPALFQYWRGNFFPEFFGFGNNLAINQLFDKTVTPACSGTGCTSLNPRLTYIYPVFNPFAASGPQFFSAFAPNTRGFTETFADPVGKGEGGLNLHVMTQHLQEIQPNGFGQIAYGPGFSSFTPMTMDKNELSLQFGVPMFHRNAAVTLLGSSEHLARLDRTAYSYTPFNPATGGPDPSSGAALTTYLSIPGNTPVLFYPNLIDETRLTFAPGVTIPFTSDLTFGASYNVQWYQGAYATVETQNIAQHKSEFLTSLIYNIPKTASSIGLLFGGQRYVDKIMPTYNFNQNREALDFTIRF